ncbi:26S proteasome regulatory subunit 8, partial [Coemansia sp. RSA 2399]
MSSSTAIRGAQPSSTSNAADNGDSLQGIREYYLHKIQVAEQNIVDKTQNLRRLEAQRNTLNTRVRLLKDELNLLQEPALSVAEVVKVIGKNKVLVKLHPEGRNVVDIADGIDIASLKPTTR